ncbi:MAG: hypothetical protein QN178_01120 [Armatimonadota bacterium]|nr:hypothetical protein [Armatimonadota bacterium]
MRKAIDYLRTHPVIAGAVAIGIVGGLLLVLTAPQPAPRTSPPAVVPPSEPTPGTVASPAPVPGAQPAPAGTPSPSAKPSPRAPGAVEAGRPDPFSPLVRGGPGGGPPPAPVPPPAPLPPPLFPGQPGQPGQPGLSPTPAPPPKEASTAQLVGILSDSSSVAIIRLGNQTYIVSPGDVLLDKIRVTTIDFAKGLVILEEDGEQFELKMGGVNGAHVAVAPRLGYV